MVVELNVAQPLDRLSSIECPQRGGINFPCAICQECEIGEVTLTSGDGYLIENTVNSILIHMELGIQDDPLEKAALKFLKQNLSDKVPAIQKGEWELGDFQIMLTNDMIRDPAIISQVKSFIENFPREFRQLMISAKRQMTKWSESVGTQLAHRFFRGQ